MQNVLATWSALDLRRRIIIIGATVAMFAAVLALGRIAGQTQMALLYAGLEPASAGEVVAALEQRGVAHEVRGDSIFVDAAQRDGLRMALASEGLPTAGGGGYELLDSLSGFGTTSQMFDAAYWRAKGGGACPHPSCNTADQGSTRPSCKRPHPRLPGGCPGHCLGHADNDRRQPFRTAGPGDPPSGRKCGFRNDSGRSADH